MVFSVCEGETEEAVSQLIPGGWADPSKYDMQFSPIFLHRLIWAENEAQSRWQ